MTFRNGHDHGIIEFIANHCDKELKVTFTGRGASSIILRENDKLAIRDAYKLSKLITSLENMELEIKQLQN